MLLYILSVFTSIVIALAVLVNRPKQKTNQMFALFILFASLWLTGVFLNSVPENILFPMFKMVFSLSIPMVTTMYLFVRYIVRPTYKLNRTDHTIIWLSVVMFIISLFTNLVNESVRRISTDSGSLIIPERGPLYIIAIAWVLGLAIYSLKLLFTAYRHSTNKIIRLQIQLVFLALGFATIIPTFSNVILPLVTGNTEYSKYAPLALASVAVIIGYSIVRHNLMDIRTLVIRTVAYIIVFALIGLGFAFSISTINYVFIGSSQLSLPLLLATTATTLIFAALYQPAKHFFDEATKRFFLRDAYSLQQVVNSVGSILTREIDLYKVVDETSKLIFNTLTPTFMRMTVFKDGGIFIDHYLGEENRPPKTIDRKLLSSSATSLIIRDDTYNKSDIELLDLLDAEVILKLQSGSDLVGAIVLGAKRSGSIYTQQDIDFLSILQKELAVAIQNARYFEQIQEFNVKLQNEIAKATAELQASNKRLKELDEAKDEFVSMASHQLRTPLTSVKGYLSMVLDGDAGKISKEQKKLLSEAFASAQRMVYLIADLLNVSRLKTGKFVIEPNEVCLPDLVEQEVNQILPTANARGLKLKYIKPKNFPLVKLDETKIRQVVMNFIDNAIYYTKPGGEIEVRLVAKRDTIEFTVKDSGIGVPEEERPKLFTKFYRASNARKARPDGTGLGLYMAQRVISEQGGSIIFESKLGEGSIFGFSFPRKLVEIKKTANKKSLKKSKSKPTEPSE